MFYKLNETLEDTHTYIIWNVKSEKKTRPKSRFHLPFLKSLRISSNKTDRQGEVIFNSLIQLKY